MVCIAIANTCSMLVQLIWAEPDKVYLSNNTRGI